MAATTTVSDGKVSPFVSHHSNANEITYRSFNERDRERFEMWEAAQILVRKWVKSPPFEEDDGLTPPSSVACDMAVRFLCILEHKFPDYIFYGRPVADGDGGISFTVRFGPITDRFEVSESGEVHRYTMHSSRVVREEAISLD